MNLIFHRDRKELFIGLGICLLNSSIHRTVTDDTLLIELARIPHVIALVCGAFLVLEFGEITLPVAFALFSVSLSTPESARLLLPASCPLTVISGCTVANHHSSILRLLPFNEKAGRPKTATHLQTVITSPFSSRCFYSYKQSTFSLFCP